jgi:hypothetical protein
VGAREEERGGVLSGVSTGGGGTEQRRALEIAEGLRTDGEREYEDGCGAAAASCSVGLSAGQKLWVGHFAPWIPWLCPARWKR